MSAGDPPRPCPVCGTPLRALPLGTTVALACTTCGGAWLRGHHLDTELDARVPDATWLEGFLAAAPPESGHAGDTPRACPDCAGALHPLRWQGPAGAEPVAQPVVVERCPSACGIWVDAGEIDRLVEARLDAIASIPARGLLRAMAREIEQATRGEEPLALAFADLGHLLRLLARRVGLAAPAAASVASLGRTHG